MEPQNLGLHYWVQAVCHSYVLIRKLNSKESSQKKVLSSFLSLMDKKIEVLEVILKTSIFYHINFPFGISAPVGIRTRVAGSKGQNDWPDYTTGANIVLCNGGNKFSYLTFNLKISHSFK